MGASSLHCPSSILCYRRHFYELVQLSSSYQEICTETPEQIYVFSFQWNKNDYPLLNLLGTSRKSSTSHLKHSYAKPARWQKRMNISQMGIRRFLKQKLRLGVNKTKCYIPLSSFFSLQILGNGFFFPHGLCKRPRCTLQNLNQFYLSKRSTEFEQHLQ